MNIKSKSFKSCLSIIIAFVMIFTNVFTGLGIAKAYAEPIIDSTEKSEMVGNDLNIQNSDSTTESAITLENTEKEEAIRFEKTEVAKGENIKIFFTCEHIYCDYDLYVYNKNNEEVDSKYGLGDTGEEGKVEIEYDTSKLEVGDYTFKIKVCYDDYEMYYQEYSTEKYVKVNAAEDGEVSSEIKGVVDVDPIENNGVEPVKIKDVEVLRGEELPPAIIMIMSDGSEVEKDGEWSSSASTDKGGISVVQVIVDGKAYYVTLKVLGESEEDNDDEIDGITGASLKLWETSVNEGENVQLEINFTPEDAVIKDIKWESDNHAVATVENGVVTGVKEGNTTIRMDIGKGKFTDSCDIKVMKKDKIPISKKIDEAIEDLKKHFEDYDGKFSDTYDYKIAMGLRRTGTAVDEIDSKKNIYGMSGVNNDARNIMTLIASGNNPKNYKNKNYVDSLLNDSDKFYEDDDSELVAKAIIALEMAGVEYEKEAAVKGLIAKGNDEGNDMISFGKTDSYWDEFEGDVEEYTSSTEATALVLTAFSFNRDIDGVDETIIKIKNYLKSFKHESGLIKEKTGWNEEESASATSAVIQALIALEEDPLSDEWISENSEGKKINMIEGLLSCKEGEQFSNTPDSTGGSEGVSSDVMLALIDFREGNSVFNELKFIEVSKAVRVEIQGEKDITLVEGDTAEVSAKAYDGNKLVVKDAEIKWITSDETVAAIENGKITAIGAGKVNITASLKDDDTVSDSISINVEENSGLSKELKNKVKNEIEFLKRHYSVYDNYEFLSSPAARIAGVNKEHIQNNIHKYSRPSCSIHYAKTIIALVGGEFNPSHYVVKGKTRNYVDVLRASQVKDGKYKGQFIINEYMDGNAAEYQANSIIALDMVQGEYDRGAAVKAIIDLVNSEEYKKSSSYKQVKTEGVILTALSSYKHIDGVEEVINKLIEYIKTQQNKDGGFDLDGGYFPNSPVATGAVMQGLIANGINPLISKEWIKDDKTMLDSLLMAKYEKENDDKNSGYAKSDGKIGEDYQATYHTFAALVDVYNDESMFSKLKTSVSESEKGEPSIVKINDIKDKVLLPGYKVNLYGMAFDENENWLENAEIELASSNSSVVKIENGLVTALSSGRATITAKIKGTEIVDIIEFTVEGSDAVKIEVEASSKILKAGEKINFTAKAKDIKDNTVEGKEFKWVSSNPKVATVDEKLGEVTAVSSGTVVITAMLKNNESIKADIKIKVVEEKNSKIRVRVEGFSKTLYNEEIDFGFSSETTPIDVLRKAIGEDSVKGTSSGIGLFITSILGEEQGENKGWCYYVKFKDGNIIMPSVGVEQFDGMTNLKGESISEELVFYICSYSGSNIITKIPSVTVKKDGADFKVTITNNEVGNKPIKNVDVKVENERNYKTDENGEVSFSLNKSGTYNIEISKDGEYPEIVRQYLVIESEGSRTQELQNVIEELKKSYKAKDDLKAIDIMAYNSLMNDKNDYKTTFKLNDSDNAAAYAENIMGLLATAQDTSYYVGELVKSQNEEGEFVVGSSDEDSVTTLADSITALDMAKAKYNIGKAVNALVNSAKDGHYEDVTTTAYALRALLKHKDIEGVESLITSCLAHLQEEQLSNGGYDYYTMGNSPYSTGPVVQALILAKEDLTADKWKKGDRTLVDSLLACQLGDGTFQSSETMGYGMSDPGASEFAFAALSDIYSGTSMYERFISEDSGTEKDTTKPVIKTNIREKIEKAIDSSSNIFIGQQEWNSWQIIGITRAGKSVPKGFIDSINVNNLVKATDYEKTILGVLAAGEDPMDFNGINLIEKLCDIDLPSKSINGIVYGLIVLDAGKYKLPKDTTWTRENLIESLVNKQNKDGGWSFFGEISDPDMTGMAMTALAPYNNPEHVNVQEAINKAVERLSATQISDGEHKGAFDIQGQYPTAANGNSTAQVLMGLSCNGIDPTGEKFTKNGNTVVDALLSFQSENGGFGFTDNEYNGYATEQVLYALEQYIYYLDGKGSIFSWGDKNPIEEIIIENLTGVDNFKLGKDAKITIQATNNKQENQNIVLIVALFDGEGKFITYNAMEYIIESGKNVKLKTMMKLPESGEYNIKCLIWDSFEGMNELSESIKLKVIE